MGDASWQRDDQMLWHTDASMAYCSVMPDFESGATKARVMPDGRVSLPAGLRKKHGLTLGGEVIVEDAGDAIILRTVDQVVARAQELSRKLVGDNTSASVDDFLADRAREVAVE